MLYAEKHWRKITSSGEDPRHEILHLKKNAHLFLNSCTIPCEHSSKLSNISFYLVFVVR